MVVMFLVYFFFFQAEDGIRDIGVTGVQTCALPIFSRFLRASLRASCAARRARAADDALLMIVLASVGLASNQCAICSLQTRCTKPLTSVLPSLVFVWPSNCGSPILDRKSTRLNSSH